MDDMSAPIDMRTESAPTVVLSSEHLAAPRGVVIGEILSRDADGRIWLQLPPPSGGPVCASCCLCDPLELAVGSRVAVLFQERNPGLAVVVGPIVAELNRNDGPGPTMPEAITLEAERQITLRCGKSSIQLQKDGTLLIRGAYVLSRASGTNRIRGGNVQIN